MSDRTLVIQVVKKMPRTATLDEIAEEVAILAAIERGRRDIEAGRVIPHEEVEKRVAKWFRNSQ